MSSDTDRHTSEGSAKPDAGSDGSTVDTSPGGPERGARENDTTDADEAVPNSRRGRRDVEVPMRLYKTITVFSTLIAVVCVVTGFVLVDAATLQVSFLRAAITGVLGAVGLSVPANVLSTVLAVVGLLVIGTGAGVYTLSTRFRAHGMGKSQEDAGEHSDNG